MDSLTREVRNVQNPALGAGLLWRFACGYIESHSTRDPVPLPLAFLVLPIVFHERSEELVAGTQRASGLRAFAAKFGNSDNSMQDVLLAVHGRMLALRNLTRESLQVALATRLLSLETTGTLVALSQTRAIAGIPDDVRHLMRSAEKLGHWCSLLTIHEVATTLKVRF
jgi:hypothetical protein